MSILAILGTIDELDVLPRTIAHLRSIGVDRIVVFDAGSTDGSLDHLAQEERVGDVWLVNDVIGGPPQSRVGLRTEIIRASDAEWVMLLDSDEFWLPREGSLRSLPELREADVISVMRYNVVLGPDGPVWPERLEPATYPEILLWAQPMRDIYRTLQQAPETPWIEGLLEPKVLVRREAFERTQAGSHYVDVTAARPWRHAVARDVLIAHVPFRTLERYEMRARNAAASVARIPDWYRGGQGWQFELAAREIRTGTTRAGFEKHRLDRAAVERLRRSRTLRTPDEMMARPIPSYPSDADHDAAVGRAQPWLGVAARICELAGIEPTGKLLHLSTGRIPTVLVPPDHVVRMFSRRHAGHRVHATERAAHERLERRPDLAVPRLVAAGELDEEWRYLVLTAAGGTSLASALEREVHRASRIEAVAWIGRWVDEVRAVPLTPEEQASAVGHEAADIAGRTASLRPSLDAACILPPTLVASVEAWIPPPSELVPEPGGIVMTHGDLDVGHVFGRYDRRAARFEPDVVVDLATAAPGHPWQDLGPMWWSLLRGDRRMTRAFLDAADLPGRGASDFPRRALAWVLLHPPRIAVGPLDVTDGETLDDLAERWFGSTSDRPAYVPAGVAGA